MPALKGVHLGGDPVRCQVDGQGLRGLARVVEGERSAEEDEDVPVVGDVCRMLRDQLRRGVERRKLVGELAGQGDEVADAGDCVLLLGGCRLIAVASLL